ncbi:MAG: endolytic transglycosylase MltG [Candidatus Latescibacteria bacterium]|nr:endolytic transglycosylase MltG [Candidatus Latescibacterota bacterium]
MTGFIQKCLFGAAFVMFGAVVLFTGWVYRGNLPSGFSDSYTIEIKHGMSAGEIADSLKAKGAIRSAFFFKVIAELRGYSGRFKSGAHKLDGSMTTDEIARILMQNPPAPPDIKVTVIEGLTIRETASALQKTADIDSAEFVDLASDNNVAKKLGIDNVSLEGYLYPDTYYVRVGTTPMEMIKRMTDHFFVVFDDSLKLRAKNMDMSVNDVVTLASLIVSEAGNDEERPLVSQVFHRRMKLGRPLEANPTIQYALGVRRRVLDEDLTVDSPYNTYINKGLPPGPIANPGKKSLIAALFPAESSYLYFVADGKGGNIFSRTLAEHNRAVRLYKRQRRQSSMH